MLRDWLGGWLRRLANRISPAPSAAARAGAQVGFNRSLTPEVVMDIDEVFRYWQKRGPGSPERP